MLQRAKALNAVAKESPAPPPSTSNGSAKGRKKKGLKAAGTDSQGLLPSSGSGLEEEGSPSALAPPQLAAPRQYDAISREKWRLELHPQQVSVLALG